jgi:hypothetical protein
VGQFWTPISLKGGSFLHAGEHPQALRNVSNRVAALGDLLDGFDLEFFGVALAAQVILLRSFFITQECLRN